MTAHEINIILDEGAYITRCPTCDFEAKYDATPGGEDDITASMAFDYAQFEHLVQSDYREIAFVRVTVGLSRATLTRREHSYVGKLANGERVIIAKTADGQWQGVFNEDLQPIGMPGSTIFETIYSIELTTGHKFK